jgi:hypothetical protein
MPSYFTYFPKDATIDNPPVIDGRPIDRLYKDLRKGDLYIQCGICSDDQIYSITVENGELFLLGKFIAEERRDYPNEVIDHSDDLADLLPLWDDDHIARALTAQGEHRLVPSRITYSLRLRKNGQDRRLRFTRSNGLDRQALYGIRKLTVNSARLLDMLLDSPADTGDLLDLQPTSDPIELERRVMHIQARGPISRPTGQAVPERIQTETSVYARDPAVKAWVLQQAEGRCELCGNFGPFQLPSGETYLEVHHVQPLAAGGPDVVENAAAICPNCHRRLHLSADADEQREVLYVKVGRLIR